MSPTFSFAASMRARDRLHPAQDKHALLATFFPATPAELALDLSNVTSMFYGLMLQVARDRFGAEVLDELSRTLFYRLGRAKSRATRSAKQEQFEFHGDARDLVTILLSAIYDASPEYEVTVERFEADLCIVHLSGVDRYYRAAVQLGIVEHLRWPTLHPFFEGVNDELSLDCDVHSQLLGVAERAELHARYVFSRRQR